MCTTICTTAKPMTISAVAWAGSTPVMTRANGMAVRITDSTKPIM